MLVIYTVYFVACFGVYAYIFYTQPVFKPPANASLDECKIQYYEWLDAYNKWNDDTRFALADPVSLAQAIYYALCSIATAVGIALIYRTNKKTVYKNIKVGTKWFWYIVHILALSLVSLSQLAFFWVKDDRYGYATMVSVSTYSATLVLMCVIIWQQALLR